MDAQRTFFSIVIPAHNEENYIAQTLQKLDELEYPKERFEIIVVENGSTDKTFDAANAFASSRIKVVSIKERGVSRARNYGASLVNPASEWIFFLDADTHVDPPFLMRVHAFLQKHANRGYVAGTCSLRPYPSSMHMEFFHFWQNVGFCVFGNAYGGALFVKHDLFTSIRFDENLHVNEDSKFAKMARKKGKFFFFITNNVHTSTRRFQNGGLKKMPVLALMWVFQKFIPESVWRRFEYAVKR